MKRLILSCIAAICLPLAASADFAFAMERCVSPQLEGRELSADGLVETTADALGYAPDKRMSQATFFQDAESGMILAVLDFYGLQACMVGGFAAEDTDSIVDLFWAQVTENGLISSPECESRDPTQNILLLAGTHEANDRRRFITAGLAGQADGSNLNLLIYETKTVNTPLNCSQAARSGNG